MVVALSRSSTGAPDVNRAPEAVPSPAGQRRRELCSSPGELPRPNGGGDPLRPMPAVSPGMGAQGFPVLQGRLDQQLLLPCVHNYSAVCFR